MIAFNFSTPQIPSLQQQSQIQKEQAPSLKQQVYTVFQSLQDQYVKKNLEVDLGTLSEFIDLNNTEMTVPQRGKDKQKRKKQDMQNQDDLFLKSKANNQQNLTPLQVLQLEDDEKKRQAAAKTIIDQIFNSIYGEDVDKFLEQNNPQIIKQQLLDPDGQLQNQQFLAKKQKKTLAEKIEILEKNLLNPTQNQIANNQSVPVHNKQVAQVKQQNEQLKKQKSMIRIDKSSSVSQKSFKETGGLKLPAVLDDNKAIKLKQSNRNFDSNKTDKEKRQFLQFILNLARVSNGVKSILSQYYGSIKLEIEEMIKPCDQESQLRVILDQQNLNSKMSLSKFRKYEERQYSLEQTDEIFVKTFNHLVVHNTQITAPFFMFVSLNQYDLLTHVSLIKSDIQSSLLTLALNYFLQYSQLKVLDIAYSVLYFKHSEIISEIVKKNTLERLMLRQVHLDSKMFIQIGFGMAEQNILSDIDFSENQIDTRGQQTLETLIRYVRSIQSLDVSSNQLYSNDEEKQKLLFGMKKAVLFNKDLKHKNIKI